MAWNSKQPQPVQSTVPTKPLLSDQWADSVAQIVGLENALESTKTALQDMTNKLKVTEGLLQEERREKIELLNQRDHYLNRFHEVYEAMKIGSRVFYDAMDRAEKKDKLEEPKEHKDVPAPPDPTQSPGQTGV